MQLPLIISIPHGGMGIPPEAVQRMRLSRQELFEDGDAFTLEIYGAAGLAADVVTTQTARAVVDLNRPEEMRPPRYPDGVIKSHTCQGRPVYREGMIPDPELQSFLIQRYHRPYHDALEQAAASGRAVLGLDCHSMAAVGPAIGPDPGKPRPLINLGNDHGRACSPEITRLLKRVFVKEWDLPEKEVTLNRPFAGGHITRTHGNRPLPWIQIEMNRCLYLADPWFDPVRLAVAPDRLRHMNRTFQAVLKTFYHQLAGKGEQG